ncbi:MAG: hypothetical protein M1829_005472 [Trizodia sp. TS-e1964]|nr:MAG: hypothetical protein M1829_005472 [Trizodia sp. TS-e1964]
MSKSRRAVKFQHRGGQHSTGVDGFSDISEGGSQPGSPVLGNGTGDELHKSESDLPPPSDYDKKKQTFITRTIWTFVMLAGFFGCISAGHIWIIAIVTTVQVVSFKEVIAIANVPTRARSLKFTKSLDWFFLATFIYWSYGESVIYYFKHIVLVDKVLLPFATYHRFISFMLYIMGFVFFVGSLQKGHYRYQFSHWAFTQIALILIVGLAHLTMNNIFEGMIWFFIPISLVITNDIFAYICGITFGRTPLIKLSPKKTVEGFLGAWVLTILFGLVMTYGLIQYKYFICPVNNLGASIFTGLECIPNPVFLPRTYYLPSWTTLNSHTLTFAPIMFHVPVLATFASLIAPFGGFFASGLKRTFKIKDFGDSIPGHGGITDRMDCQFLMGAFMFMYYQSFIAVYKTSVGSVIETAINGLSPEEQVEVVRLLSKYLYNQGVVNELELESLTLTLR